MAQHVSDPVYLGDFKEDATVDFQWGTYDDNNASVTRATDGTVQVYKDNGVTQSVAGITDTEDFDSLTGLHACTIDLSADAFYSVGSNYTVVVAAATIDGDIINSPIAHFSIENRAPILAIGTPIVIDSGTASIAGMLTKMADDNGGADFDAEIDSLNKNSVTELLATTVDTVALATIITEILARTNGKYTVDDPTTGDITFKKRDSATTSHVVNVTSAGRTRTSP